MHYRDPKLAVVVLAADANGRLLYIRRNHEPAMYRWAWPSGYVDAGERVEQAAVREVREETGLEIELDGPLSGRPSGLLGIWSRADDPVVVVGCRARPIGGALRPGPEALAAAWFPLGRRPELAFPHDAEILQTYVESLDRSASPGH